MKDSWANSAYLIILCSLGYFATDIYLPSLPAIAEEFGIGEAHVQMTMVAYLLSFAITPLVFGPLSDHYGRKKIILVGLILTLLASIGCALSNGISTLLFFRLAQGIGTGAVVIASRASIPDRYEGKDLARQYSYLTTGMPIVLSLAPLLGGYIQEYYYWQGSFWFLSFYVCILLLIAYNASESLQTPRSRTLKEVGGIYRQILMNRAFMLYGVSVALPSLALLGYLTASPFLFQVIIGLSPVEYGSLAVYIGLIIIVASALNTQLLKKVAILTLIRVGFSCIILGGVGLLLVHAAGIMTKWSLLGPILLFFCCLPFAVANSAATAMHQVKEHFGSAGAVLATTQLLSGFIGSLIFSYIEEVTVIPLALCLIVVGLLAQVSAHLASRAVVAGK